MKRPPLKPQPDQGKSAFAFSVGEAFYEVARPVLEGLSSGLQQGADHAATSGASLGVAVTNLGFALEMYLKALRLLVGVEVPENHDLWVLYKSLPIEVKEAVETRHDELVGARDATSIFTLSFLVEAAAEGRWEEPKIPRKESGRTDVPNLLRRAGRLAVTWRYPHDAVPAGQRFSPVQSFEHTLLGLFKEALTAEIRRRNPRLR